MGYPEKNAPWADSRAKQAMEMYAKAAQAGQSYLTEVAMPGCRPDAVNPDEVEQHK